MLVLEAADPMRKLAHISDLHFGRIDEEVVEALLVDLRGLGPDLIVVSGDLTQRAHRLSSGRHGRFWTG
jgi:3',5'-cyclic AMP phosphodiesterase CpdA